MDPRIVHKGAAEKYLAYADKSTKQIVLQHPHHQIIEK